MGAKDNSALVDELVNDNYIHTQKVERVLRLVDRGIFVSPQYSSLAYRDAPFRTNNRHPGQIHISAPSIYCSVLEMLDLHKGQSFLNIGSGSGYFSALVGFLIGENGTSHGVELHSNIIDHAHEALNIFTRQKFISGYDWCRPQFVHGNAFSLSGISKLYDRIYVGAQVDQCNLALFTEMLKQDGIMIVPVRIEDATRFQRVKRTSNGFESRDFMHVAFAELIHPNAEIHGPDHRNESSSRKRKIIEDSSNPNDCVTDDLLTMFAPRSLEMLACFAIRKKIADSLRVTFPIAIVQKLGAARDQGDVMNNFFQRHRRNAERIRRGAAHPWIHAMLPAMRFLDFDNRRHVPQIPRFRNRAMEVATRERIEVLEAMFNNRVREYEGRAETGHVDQAIGQHLFDHLHRDAVERYRFDPLFRNNRDVENPDDDEEDGDNDDDENMDMDNRTGGAARDEPHRLMADDGEAAHAEIGMPDPIPPDEETANQNEIVRDFDLDTQITDQIFAPTDEEEDDEDDDDDLIERLQFRGRARRHIQYSDDDDEETISEAVTRHNCCRSKASVPTLKGVADRALSDRRHAPLVRAAKNQPWVVRIGRLSETYRPPTSFADQIPEIFKEKISDPLPNGRLAIEDWYLQNKKNQFITTLATLEKAVLEIGRMQFAQEQNDFPDISDFSETNIHLHRVTFRSEEDSISRFEKKIVEILSLLPLPENGKMALKWNLFRDG